MDSLENLWMIPLVVLSAVGSGLTYFLIDKLPKKFGYPKFILICLGYVFFLGAIIAAVTNGIISGRVFLVLLFAPTPFGAMCLWHELMEDMKKAFKIE